jgi:hypothetical protein
MQVLVQEWCDKKGEVTDRVKFKGKVKGDAITAIKVPDTVKFKSKVEEDAITGIKEQVEIKGTDTLLHSKVSNEHSDTLKGERYRGEQTGKKGIGYRTRGMAS